MKELASPEMTTINGGGELAAAYQANAQAGTQGMAQTSGAMLSGNLSALVAFGFFAGWTLGSDIGYFVSEAFDL
jgi:hypothetical protein